MKSSKKNQGIMAASQLQPWKSEEHELSEEALDAMQGGALSPEDMQHAQQIISDTAKHNGVNISAKVVNDAAYAGIAFGAETLGQILTKPKKQQSQ